MQILQINNDINFKSGLYFTKSSAVLFNHDLKFITKDEVKTSPSGARYIEDNLISEQVKDKFANVPFIKKLAEKFDTFIWFCQIPRESENEKFLSTAKITWADYSKSHAQSQMAYAVSDTSEEESFKKLLSKIEQKDFFV